MRRRPGRGGLGTSMADVNAVDMDLTTASSPSGRGELPRGRDRRECLVNLGCGVGAQICREVPIRGGESQPATGRTQPKHGSPAVMPGRYFCWSSYAGASTGVPFTNVRQAVTAPGDQAVAVADSEEEAGLDAPTEADNNCGAEVTCRLPPPTSTTAAAMNATQMPW